jgi:hypothetical protein
MNTFIPDFSPDVRHKDGNSVGDVSHTPALSLESQLRLREFYVYVDNSLKIVNEIHEDLSAIKSIPDGSLNLQKVSERLGKFCIEADSWGFNDLYEVGMGLQIFLLNSGGRIQSDGGDETIDRGLATLSTLLRRCENDFRWRLAMADSHQ